MASVEILCERTRARPNETVNERETETDVQTNKQRGGEEMVQDTKKC